MTDPAQPSQTGWWESNRVEAFSDGVMAVIITIMAFGLEAPNGTTFTALQHRLPALLIYLLSFTFIGIYWNNHHHLLRATTRMNGAVMWANLHLLFWLSLIPVLTKWVASSYRSSLPASAYGVVACAAGIAYYILSRAILAANKDDKVLRRAIGSDAKGVGSVVAYAAAVGLAWVSPWIAYAIYVGVAITWFVPDRRLAVSQGDVGEAEV
jgi:uncharacterized membrane protein